MLLKSTILYHSLIEGLDLLCPGSSVEHFLVELGHGLAVAALALEVVRYASDSPSLHSRPHCLAPPHFLIYVVLAAISRAQLMHRLSYWQLRSSQDASRDWPWHSQAPFVIISTTSLGLTGCYTLVYICSSLVLDEPSGVAGFFGLSAV